MNAETPCKGPIIADLIRDYTTGTSTDERSIHCAYALKLREETTNLKDFGGDLRRLIYVGTVEDKDAPIMTTKVGYVPVWSTNPILEGHHYASKYHPSVKRWSWEFNTSFSLTSKQSVYDKDAAKFRNAQEAGLAIKANLMTVATSWQMFMQTMFMLMFVTPDDLKKMDRTGKKGNGGIYTQILAKIDAKFDTDGYTWASQDPSIEQLSLPWDETNKVPKKPGESGGKLWKNKERPLINALDLLREVIWVNEVDTKKHVFNSTLHGALDGSGDDLDVYLGWFFGVKDYVELLTTTYSWDFNIGCKVNRATGECSCPVATILKDASKKDLAIALGIGCVKDDEVQCICCSNTIPRTVNPANLVMLTNVSLQSEFAKQWPVDKPCPTLNGAYFGIGEVMAIPGFPKDKFLLIEKGVLNMYIKDVSSRTARQEEYEFTNHIKTLKFALGVFPGVCVAITKPGYKAGSNT